MEVLEKYGLKNKYVVLRLSALASHHDVASTGFSFETEKGLMEYIKKLEEYGSVVIFSETLHWQTIKEYQFEIDSKDLHDILFYATICIGEGATMAS